MNDDALTEIMIAPTHAPAMQFTGASVLRRSYPRVGTITRHLLEKNDPELVRGESVVLLKSQNFVPDMPGADDDRLWRAPNQLQLIATPYTEGTRRVGSCPTGASRFGKKHS